MVANSGDVTDRPYHHTPPRIRPDLADQVDMAYHPRNSVKASVKFVSW
jgi:hypothetical protein